MSSINVSAIVSSTVWSFRANFAGIKLFPKDIHTASPTVELAGSLWNIEVCPVSKYQKLACYVNYLGNENLTVDVNLTMECYSGTDFHILRSGVKFSPGKRRMKAISNWCKGIDSFDNETYHLPLHLTAWLEIQAELTVYESHVEKSTNQAHMIHCIERDNNALPCDLETMMCDETFSDVTIVADDDTRIPVHKVVLCARSDVFKTMFTTEMSESATNEIVITDCPSNALKAFCTFLYSDKYDDSTDNAQAVFMLAHKYQVPKLLRTCEHQLVTALTDVNSMEMLMFAETYATVYLKSAAAAYIHRQSAREMALLTIE